MSSLNDNERSRKTEVESASKDYQDYTRAIADAARHKRDAAHITQAGFDSAQEAFEQASRVRDRAEGIVEESLYSHDNVRMREANEREQKIKAKEQNARRTILDRLMGRNKASSYDVMRAEAERMNRVVDQRVANEGGMMSHQEAANEVAYSKEFMPDTWSETWGTGRQEAVANLLARIRSEAPTVERDLDAGQANSFARFVAKQKEQTRTREEERALEEASEFLLRQKLDTFIRARDVYAAEALLSTRDSYMHISKALLDEIPDEFMKYPEIRNALKSRLAEQGETRGQLIEELERRERELA